MAKEVKVRIEAIYKNPKVTATKFISNPGVTEWSPPGKTDKYLFIGGGDFIPCKEWGRSFCKVAEQYLKEGDIVFGEVSSGSWSYRETTKFIARVKEGAKIEINKQGLSGVKAENLELIKEIDQIDLTECDKEMREKGYKLTTSRPRQNCLALELLKISKQKTECKSKESSACEI